jgi:hypothetical protein
VRGQPGRGLLLFGLCPVQDLRGHIPAGMREVASRKGAEAKHQTSSTEAQGMAPAGQHEKNLQLRGSVKHLAVSGSRVWWMPDAFTPDLADQRMERAPRVRTHHGPLQP